ncbi:MAG: flagellar filament capping protein FliD [Peptococcaceae bacterium]|nr:flagellar filament capping protein FliD [Peptococcaceae bacterium]
MINGVSGYSQNYLEMLYKYHQAIGTNGLNSTATSALGSTGRVSAINGVARTSNAFNNYSSNLTLNATTKQFLSRYTSTYQNLASAAKTLRADNFQGVWNKTEGYSADEQLLTVQNHYNSKKSGAYDVNVRQLAQVQKNESLALESKAESTAASGVLELQVGARKVNLDINTEGKTNEQLLAEIAGKINGNRMGVQADIVKKDGKSVLTITGNQTGMQHEFAVKGQLAEELGLNKVTQAAQDSLVDVTDKATGKMETLMESDNVVTLDSYRTSLELKQTGKTEINFGVDKDELVSKVQDMVDIYNGAVKLLNDNYESGTGVGQQLRNLLLPPISEKSMDIVGLTYNKDGTLALDSDKLVKAYEENGEQVKQLLGGKYSIADGIGDKAATALKQSSHTLTNKGGVVAGGSNYNKEDIFDMEWIAKNGRMGAYRLKNYNYIGFLMDRLI